MRSFTLLELRFGCVANLQVASIPFGCTVKVTGKRAGTGETVGPMDLAFQPPTALNSGGFITNTGAVFETRQFEDFKNLEQVEFSEFRPTANINVESSISVFVDNVKYILHR